MQTDLSSKVTIVSGSAGGIGFARARGLAESGANDFFDIPDAEWHKFLDVNVMSGVRLPRA